MLAGFCLVSIILFVEFTEFSLANNGQNTLTEKFAWKFIEYVWPDDTTKADAIVDGNYIPENNLPAGFDVWGDKLFITVPRYSIRLFYIFNMFSFIC